MISFTVLGVPQTAGSKRAFPFRRPGGSLGVRVTDDNPKGREWKNAVAWAAREVFRGPLLEGPLVLRIVFVLPRPKGHFGKRGLLDSAPARPTTKPDLLKRARAIEDSLNGIVWRDDAQIVEEVLGKFYGEPARAEVAVSALQEDLRTVDEVLSLFSAGGAMA